MFSFELEVISIKIKVCLNRHQCIHLHLHPDRRISFHFHTRQKIGSASARLRFLLFFANNADRQVHPNVLLHLLCQHIHLPPLDRDAIINPVVEVKRRRDGGG
jgi:hypothetical protein